MSVRSPSSLTNGSICELIQKQSYVTSLLSDATDANVTGCGGSVVAAAKATTRNTRWFLKPASLLLVVLCNTMTAVERSFNSSLLCCTPFQPSRPVNIVPKNMQDIVSVWRVTGVY